MILIDLSIHSDDIECVIVCVMINSYGSSEIRCKIVWWIMDETSIIIIINVMITVITNIFYLLHCCLANQINKRISKKGTP